MKIFYQESSFMEATVRQINLENAVIRFDDTRIYPSGIPYPDGMPLDEFINSLLKRIRDLEIKVEGK